MINHPVDHPSRFGLARLLAVLVGVLMLLALALPTQAKPSSRNINLQLLAINDFHGNLDPPTGSGGRIVVPPPATPANTVDAGGAVYLATHLHQLEATNPNTLIVSAGDNIGASPLTSGWFHDEPAIEVLNSMGLDISAVGNHEFDEGKAELMRMQNGGCHPTAGCQDGDGFAGADFTYLSANVINDDTDAPLLPAYDIRNVGGVRVGFIGLTLEGTPSIVTPFGVAGLTFLDEADTVNKYVGQLNKLGVHAIVVLIHEGGFQTPSGFINECNGISGAIVDIVNHFNADVDLVISGHTHQAYNCVINGMPVTSSSSFGRLVTDVDLTIDRASQDVSNVSIENKIVTRTVAQDPAVKTIVDKYNALIADVKNTVVGHLASTAGLDRTQNAAGESQLGEVIADAQLAATDNEFGSVMAFMNPGGIRADLPCLVPPLCPVTFGEVFAVQPFANDLVAMNLTGAQIKTLLETQFSVNRFLGVSNGLTYTWSASAPLGSKVSNIAVNGVALDPAATYRVTVNVFLSGGGDGFTVLASGQNKVIGPIDLDALVAYMGSHDPLASPPLNRVTALP